MDSLQKLLSKRRTPIGIALSFVVFLLCFFLLLKIVPHLYEYTVLPFTFLVTEVSALLLNLFGAGVVREGKEIITSDRLIKIIINDGCNGLYASAILIAAILCQPSAIKAKLIGLGIGFPLVFLVNQVRILTLFIIRCYDKAMMEFFHVYFWQTLMILSSVIIWMLWANYFVPKRAPQAEQTSRKDSHEG